MYWFCNDVCILSRHEECSEDLCCVYSNKAPFHNPGFPEMSH